MTHKKLLTLFAVLLFSISFWRQPACGQVSGQKPPIDTAVLDNRSWPTLLPPNISYYGNYVSYSYRNGTIWNAGPRTLVIQDIRKNTKYTFARVLDLSASFSADERKAFFKRLDTLVIIDLEKGGTEDHILTKSVKIPFYGPGRWLAYEQKGSRQLVLMDLVQNTSQNLGVVSSYEFEYYGKGLFFQTVESKGDDTVLSLHYLNFNDGVVRQVWSGKADQKIGGITSDRQSEQHVFTVSDNKGTAIWCYKRGAKDAALIISNEDKRVLNGQIEGQVRFTLNGQWILFDLQKENKAGIPKPAIAANVDVWSYKERNYPPEAGKRARATTVVVPVMLSLKTGILRELEGENYTLVSPIHKIAGNYVIIQQQDSAYRFDKTGAKFFPSSYYVLSLKDGQKRLLIKEINDPVSISICSFSPDDRWLVYFNTSKRAYYSFDLINGQSNNITGDLSERFVLKGSEERLYPQQVDDIAGWTNDSRGVLIYDNYDLWNIDPAAKRAPINTTNGYGAAHQAKLSLIGEERFPVNSTYAVGDTLLFAAFNLKNKNNGFLSVQLGFPKTTRLLTMEPYLFYQPSNLWGPNKSKDLSSDMLPQKAPGASCWIVRRQSAAEMPNYFITRDFKTFSRLTSFAPQLKYNWLTAELHNYVQLDGKLTQGILYKPENFDSSKKYPVIIHYYETTSFRLHQFPTPGWSEDEINIPWFVSNGYLVFTPDIHYTIGQPGRSAWNSVVAAANHLSKFSFVNPQRMAIQGHSFGGTQTNFIVANSNIFAAAVSACGSADMISFYGNNWSGWTRGAQGRMGSVPSLAPDMYIKESSVLRAAKVTTPLLFLNTRQDVGNFENALEFFRALYDLNKKTWMLSYDDGRHTVQGQDAIDYTIRLTQFFDHYLKGYPPPVWMTTGSSTSIENEFAPDPGGKCGDDCPICKKKDY